MTTYISYFFVDITTRGPSIDWVRFISISTVILYKFYEILIYVVRLSASILKRRFLIAKGLLIFFAVIAYSRVSYVATWRSLSTGCSISNFLDYCRCVYLMGFYCVFIIYNNLVLFNIDLFRLLKDLRLSFSKTYSNSLLDFGLDYSPCLGNNLSMNFSVDLHSVLCLIFTEVKMDEADNTLPTCCTNPVKTVEQLCHEHNIRVKFSKTRVLCPREGGLSFILYDKLLISNHPCYYEYMSTLKRELYNDACNGNKIFNRLYFSFNEEVIRDMYFKVFRYVGSDNYCSMACIKVSFGDYRCVVSGFPHEVHLGKGQLTHSFRHYKVGIFGVEKRIHGYFSKMEEIKTGSDTFMYKKVHGKTIYPTEELILGLNCKKR